MKFSTALLFCAVIGAPLCDSQSLPTYSPSSQTTLYAYVTDGNGNVIPGADIEMDNGWYEGSNIHTHYASAPPVSSISPSSGTADQGWGYLPFTLSTTLIGEEEWIDVASSLSPIIVEFDYYVGYGDLYLINNPSVWYLIGYTPNHGNDNNYNHWSTASANVGLDNATTSYLNSHSPQARICINDAVLPIGGKFDIYGNSTNPHAEHDRGSAVDIAYTYNAASNECNNPDYVVNDPYAMQDACYAAGAAYVEIHVPPEAPHVHCNFQSSATYPH